MTSRLLAKGFDTDVEHNKDAPSKLETWTKTRVPDVVVERNLTKTVSICIKHVIYLARGPVNTVAVDQGRVYDSMKYALF